jgi:UDP-2,3-diacylglucosamine hydrolase
MTAKPLMSPGWHCIEFISDLHLQVSEPETAEAWFNYMASTAADAIFILGDWFEVWVGDDNTDDFIAKCAQVMQTRAHRSRLFIMHGNRDFLLGETFAKRCQATLLYDPTRLDYHGKSYLLTHGDALCTDDVDYIRFRTMVRSSEWQKEFLAKPLVERTNIARQLRAQSQSKHGQTIEYADVNESLAAKWLIENQATVMIHGHTHKPASHTINTIKGKNLTRHVLSDWDAQSKPPRLQVLRLTVNGISRVPISL